MNATTILARTAAGLAVIAATLGGAGTAFADAPPAPAEHLTLRGDVAGTVTHATTTCTPLGEGNYSWQLTGVVDETPILLTFTTAAFHGAGTYTTTGITDEHGGLATLATEEIQVVTNGDTQGTFTIDPADDRGELDTGSIDTDLTNNGLAVHVEGTWACS